MFLDLWMIGILIAMSAFWAEYRNIVGVRQGRVQGVTDGANAMLHLLVEDKIIMIDSDGKIRPRASYKEKLSATERSTTKSRTTE